MAGYAVTRNALSAEQCKTLAPEVGDQRCIAVPAAVGALLGGKTEVPCKAARGPVRAHADRYADGSLVPDEVAVVYLAVSGETVLVLAPAGGGDEIRVALEPGLRVSWANSKFAHRVDCAPESTRIMLGPAARRGSGVEAVLSHELHCYRRSDAPCSLLLRCYRRRSDAPCSLLLWCYEQ